MQLANATEELQRVRGQLEGRLDEDRRAKGETHHLREALQARESEIKELYQKMHKNMTA